ncbi:hypothetical protein J2T12_003744 [Paenibacillus anaericanus]|uniref:DUF5071 domain-containing protein n=1 Tax=Paenibacillus anaericanus TaxID=170367 RepID=UPI002785A28F|nr:DUF5071 domain-containing protein [Paenibacillus anaericanus]MDQ0090330.1 hypothetical protein [Paenibacillus anaericanus]
MNNLIELIPKDKFDMDTVEKLKNIDLDIYDLAPIMASLFEWIQDANWPITEELCKVLAKLKSVDIIPHITEILRSGDDTWQFSCLYYLLPEISKGDLEQIKPEIIRLINNPTQNEILCEMDQAAKDIFDRLF